MRRVQPLPAQQRVDLAGLDARLRPSTRQSLCAALELRRLAFIATPDNRTGRSTDSPAAASLFNAAAGNSSPGAVFVAKPLDLMY
jgi:hypothetical protein